MDTPSSRAQPIPSLGISMVKPDAMKRPVGPAAPLRAQEAGLVAVAWRPPSSQDATSFLQPLLDLQAWPEQAGEHPG